MEDDRSHFQICEIVLTPMDFRNMMAGTDCKVDVTFSALDRIGKYHSHEAHYFSTREHGFGAQGAVPQSILDEQARLEEGDWICDSPTRNNKGQWVIIRRRYTDEPVLPPNSLTSDRVAESETPEKSFGVLPAKGKKGKKK